MADLHLMPSIADAAIRALRDEAREHGDSELVDICDIALDSSRPTHMVARRICGAVIADAAARAEDG